MDNGLNSLRAKLNSLDALARQETKRLNQYEEDRANLETKASTHAQAIRLCDLCLAGQIEVTNHIEAMNNAFLDVFEEPLELKFSTQYKADKVTISGTKAQILRDGAVDRPSRGQKTVSSLGLILAFLKLKDISQVLILDEFMSDVSVTVTPKVVDLLTKIGTQVIWVTHSQVDLPESSSKVYYVTKRAGVSSVSAA